MTDVLVIGAGMVGVCTAIELQSRGLDTVLIDRREPGRETSYGNAGVIQREGVHPYLFPRDLRKLLAYAANNRVDAHYQVSSLPTVLPFLWRYWRASTPPRARRTCEANLPLFARCLEAHGALASAANVGHLITKRGWLRIFRHDASIKAVEEDIAELRDLGLAVDVPNADALAELEPHLRNDQIAGAVHYRDPWTCSDPGALVSAYANLFIKRGGTVERDTVSGLKRMANGWIAEGQARDHQADQIVLAAGPWSAAILSEIGVKLPMGIKRGYHRHYSTKGNAYLSRTIVDDEFGFVLAPMARGIRLTTGAEFARNDAPPTPVQLERALPHARELFDLGETVDKEIWLGARPVFPDMLPAMGPVPDQPGLWLNFGHAHHGFTLGPVAGLLVAQMVAAEAPFADPAPYVPNRFL